MKRLYYGLGKANFIQYVVFAIFLLVFYLPLANLAMLAFGNRYEAPAVFPQEFGFRWWEFVLSQKSLLSAISTSFILAIVVTIVSMIICLPAAYALARYEFKGRRFLQFSFLLCNAFPKMGLYISIAIVYYKLNLMGTFVGVVLIHVINTMMFMTWIPAGAFRSVHRQQEEAARDAGAGAMLTFMKITLPMAMPGIAVASIFTFLASIEEAQGTLLVGFPQVKTIPVELYGVIMQYPTSAGPVLSIILILPTIVIMLIAKKYISADAISKGFNAK
ncbi:MAG: polyamine ABC transporter permease [Epulopiscium sp. Nuni2H_MBin003]|nr:MAG: polyamine ABC transporter permease [Epulopiscium sp. Nuni2H_MBin003]